MTVDTTLVFRGTPQAESARRAHEASLSPPAAPRVVDANWLRDLCLEVGASDAGFVELSRPGLGAEAEHARRLFPRTKSLVCLVGISNRDALRSVSRAAANVAWHYAGDRLDHAAAALCECLAQSGVGGVPTTIGFPMDMHATEGGSIWEIAHKIVAVEAGMGHMGVNRNVIHPRFGNYILLNTVLIDAEVDRYDTPLDYNPCLGCNLCVAACPVGAIHANGEFDFFACMGHNYREFLFGFTDWVDTIASEGGTEGYRAKFRESETLSMWQSLAFEPNYKSAYCMAVCPAGDDVIGPYLADRAQYRHEVLTPFLRKSEPIYVQSGTRAEKVASRKSSKQVRYLDFKPDVSTVANFSVGLRHMFRPTPEPEVGCTVAFRFPDGQLTATLDDGKLATVEHFDADAEAIVICDEPDYIRILYRPVPGRPDPPPLRYAVTGKREALELLLSQLG